MGKYFYFPQWNSTAKFQLEKKIWPFSASAFALCLAGPFRPPERPHLTKTDGPSPGLVLRVVLAHFTAGLQEKNWIGAIFLWSRSSPYGCILLSLYSTAAQSNLTALLACYVRCMCTLRIYMLIQTPLITHPSHSRWYVPHMYNIFILYYSDHHPRYILYSLYI